MAGVASLGRAGQGRAGHGRHKIITHTLEQNMSRQDDFENEFPLLYQRLVESNTPKLVFLSGTLKERINDILEPLGYPVVRGGDPLDQTLADIERFLEAQS